MTSLKFLLYSPPTDYTRSTDAAPLSPLGAVSASGGFMQFKVVYYKDDGDAVASEETLEAEELLAIPDDRIISVTEVE